MIIDPTNTIMEAPPATSMGWVGPIGAMKFETESPYFVEYLSLPEMPTPSLDTVYTFEFYDKDGMPKTLKIHAKDITFV